MRSPERHEEEKWGLPPRDNSIIYQKKRGENIKDDSLSEKAETVLSI